MVELTAVDTGIVDQNGNPVWPDGTPAVDPIALTPTVIDTTVDNGSQFLPQQPPETVSPEEIPQVLPTLTATAPGASVPWGLILVVLVALWALRRSPGSLDWE